jgi:hypothetical protein
MFEVHGSAASGKWPMPAPLDPIVRARVAVLVLPGASHVSIARRTGVSARRVGRIAHETTHAVRRTEAVRTSKPLVWLIGVGFRLSVTLLEIRQVIVHTNRRFGRPATYDVVVRRARW